MDEAYTFVNETQPREQKIQHVLNFFNRCEELNSYNSLEGSAADKRLIKLFIVKLRNNPSDFALLQAQTLKKKLSANIAHLFGT